MQKLKINSDSYQTVTPIEIPIKTDDNDFKDVKLRKLDADQLNLTFHE